MKLLKQSTAVDIGVGPFLDETDGKTAETALTITQPDIRLKKNGGNWAQKNAAQTLSHEENGWYEVALDATDTNTLGILKIAIHESGALPVFDDYMVVPAAVYDAFVSGSGDGMRSDVRSLVGVAQSATDLKHFADSGYDPATSKVEGVKLADTLTTYTGNTPQTGDSFARLGAPAGASHAVDVAAVKAQTAAIETDTQDIQTKIGSPAGASLAVDVAAVKADTAAIKAKTDNLPADPASETNVDAVETKVDGVKSKTDNLPSDPADQSLIIDATNAVMDRIGTPAGADLAADVAAVKSDTAAIAAKTTNLPADPASQAAVLAKLPAALVDGRMAANAQVVGDKADYALSDAGQAAVADKLLGRTRAGGADGGRTVAQCLAFGRNKWEISGGTLTVYADDDVTPLYTAAVATAAGDPITGVDPE